MSDPPEPGSLCPKCGGTLTVIHSQTAVRGAFNGATEYYCDVGCDGCDLRAYKVRLWEGRA